MTKQPLLVGRAVPLVIDIQKNAAIHDCRVAEDALGGTSAEAPRASLAAMQYLQTGAVSTVDALTAAIELQAERMAS